MPTGKPACPLSVDSLDHALTPQVAHGAILGLAPFTLREPALTTLQAWSLVGIPATVITLALFAGRSAVRAAIGYVVVAGTFAFFITIPDSKVSAAVIGTIGALVLATGRGTAADAAGSEHHEDRKRFTTAAG